MRKIVEGCKRKYKRIRDADGDWWCEREKTLCKSISQAVAIFWLKLVHCIEEPKEKKKKKHTSKCYGFVHISRSGPCQWAAAAHWAHFLHWFFRKHIYREHFEFNAIKYEPFYFSLIFFFFVCWSCVCVCVTLGSPTFILILFAAAARERVKCVKNVFGKIFGQPKCTEKCTISIFFPFFIGLHVFSFEFIRFSIPSECQACNIVK